MQTFPLRFTPGINVDVENLPVISVTHLLILEGVTVVSLIFTCDESMCVI